MKLATAVVVLTIIFAPMDSPKNPQCDDVTFARANPGQCQIISGPFPDFPPNAGGGGHQGGLGGLIHRLTGGLL